MQAFKSDEQPKQLETFQDDGFANPSSLKASRHAELANTWQLQRRSANIKSEYGTKEVDFKAFDPTDRKTEIASQRCVGAGAGGSQARRCSRHRHEIYSYQ